jgi:hypothetical protein
MMRERDMEREREREMLVGSYRHQGFFFFSLFLD